MKIREAVDKIIRINNELYRLEDAMLHYQAFMQMGFRNIPENEIQFKRERIKELSSERERLMDLEVSPVKVGLCKNCKHYAKTDRVEGKNFGTCSCDKFVYTGDEHLPLEDDMLIYEDFEQYNATFFVGENFGCIHFEERENG